MTETNPSRRELIALIAMCAGLLLSYGLFAVQGLLFLIPRRLAPRTRRIFAGQIDQFEIGALRTVLDLQGNEILIKRDGKELRAFNSTCPHLGCAVAWNEESARLARAHNDANMIALGERLIAEDLACRIVDVWLTTPFEGERHVARIRKLDDVR